jgi:hypothetical protein
MKESSQRNLLPFVEKELLCPQEVISVERTLRSGMLSKWAADENLSTVL